MPPFRYAFDGGIRTHDRLAQPELDGCPLNIIPQRIHRIHRRQQLHRLVANQPQKPLLRCREQHPRQSICLRRNHRDSHHQPRLPQCLARPEERSIETRRVQQHLRRKVRCKCKRQPQLRRQPRAEVAGPEQCDGNAALLPGNRLHNLPRRRRSEIRPQLCQQFGKIIARLPQIASKCAHRVEVAARSSAQAKVDPSRVQGFERSELLSDNQWRVIRQHHAAASDANGLGCSCDMPNQNGRCRTGQPFDRVMLRQPETPESPLLRMPCQLSGSRNRRARRLARPHPHKIKYRNG